MKHLLLMRHGEAEGSPDLKRRLTRSGQVQCVYVGEELRRHSLIPDAILTSSVLRVQESFNLLDFGHTPHINCGESLYRARSMADVLDIITQKAPHEAACVLVIGHNPHIQGVARHLGSGFPNAYFDQIENNYSPATLTVIAHQGNSWADLHPNYCEITRVIRPA